jgi:hypothetical protein
MIAVRGHNMNESIIQDNSEPIKQTSKSAMASLVFGVLSLVSFTFGSYFTGDVSGTFFIICILTAIVAVSIGLVALFRIKKHPNLKGKGMAILGLVFGGLIILFALLLFGGIFLSIALTGHFGGAID